MLAGRESHFRLPTAMGCARKKSFQQECGQSSPLDKRRKSSPVPGTEAA
jgi:hypothetical protein